MVQSFTIDEVSTYNTEQEKVQMTEEELEQGLKQHLQSLMRNPSERTIENILSYSKSFGKGN